MRYQVPYRKTVEVIAYRLNHSLNETASKFGISRQAIIGIMHRNGDLVERLKTQIEQEVVRDAKRSV